MTGPQYRATLVALGITQARLSRLLQVDKSTPSDWASRGPPRAVALIVEAMATGLLTMEALEEFGDD